MHYDPNLSIFKAHGMYAGSLGEYEVRMYVVMNCDEGNRKINEAEMRGGIKQMKNKKLKNSLNFFAKIVQEMLG